MRATEIEGNQRKGGKEILRKKCMDTAGFMYSWRQQHKTELDGDK